MKKAFFTLIILLMTLNISAQKIDSNNFVYQDGVEFYIKRFNSAKFSEYGNGTNQTLYIAQGSRFKSMWAEFTNNTDEDVIIDFEKFTLLDDSNNKYEVHAVGQSMKLSNSVERYQMKLKAGKTKLFIVEFWPPFPKDEKIHRLEVNGQVLNF